MNSSIFYIRYKKLIQGGTKMKGTKKSMPAKMLEAIARKSAGAAADSRCMFIYHQPKQPEGLKKFKK